MKDAYFPRTTQRLAIQYSLPPHPTLPYLVTARRPPTVRHMLSSSVPFFCSLPFSLCRPPRFERQLHLISNSRLFPILLSTRPLQPPALDLIECFHLPLPAKVHAPCSRSPRAAHYTAAACLWLLLPRQCFHQSSLAMSVPS